MKDSWNENDSMELKKAADAYRSIQAPSDLRERVLQGAAEKEKGLREDRHGGISRRKIYRLGTLAACAAVLVVSVHLGFMQDELVQISQETVGDYSAAELRSIEEQLTGSFYHTSKQIGPFGVDEDAADGAVGSISETEEKEEADISGDFGITETDRTGSTDFGAGSAGKAGGAAQVVQDQDESGDSSEKTGASLKAPSGSDGVSVGKLLPGILGQEETFSDWEIRLVDSAEGGCIVEVDQGSQVTTMVLSREEDSSGGSQWEIQYAENTMKS